MKATYQTKFGAPDVLQYGDLPDPAPGAGEVLVRVRATSVNPLDTKLRSGGLAFMQGRKFPKILGCDVSGEVAAVGAGVTAFAAGDAVAGLLDEMSGLPGADAELVVTTPDRLCKKPAGVSHADAAASSCAGVTAWQAVKVFGGVGPGKKVLVNGASGGVGSFAVQIAKVLGGHVTAVCSAANADLVRSWGADDVVDYKTKDFRSGGGPYDVVLDAMANASFASCRGVMAKDGVYVSTLPSPSNLLWKLLPKKRKLELASGMKAVVYLPEVLSLVESKKIRVAVEKSFALKDLAAAHALSESGRVKGKITVDVA